MDWGSFFFSDENNDTNSENGLKNQELWFVALETYTQGGVPEPLALEGTMNKEVRAHLGLRQVGGKKSDLYE